MAKATPDDIEHTLEDIEALRAQLTADEQASVDTNMLQRFYRATGGNIPQSTKRLQTTLAWRKLVQPERVVCKACAANCRSHYMHLIGHDLLNRPIIYSSYPLASNKTFEDNRDHMIATFEMAVKCMGPGAEQWVWLCDFHGFGVADMSVRLARAFLEMSADHYPERLGLFMVVDAPLLFSALWRAVSSFVDVKTHKKIRFLPYDLASKKSALKTEMALHFGEETMKWVLDEMKENRDKKVILTKRYDMSEIYQQACNGTLAPAEAVHDVHGTASIVRLLAAKPAVMEPQGPAAATH